VNARELVQRVIAQELMRHGLWVAMRRCACRGWGHKTERGQARCSYAELVAAHSQHVADVIARRLLDCGGLPPKEFSARDGSDATGEATPSAQTTSPHAAARIRPAENETTQVTH
jgi:hypothetical protein